jgi:hypothetical protein
MEGTTECETTVTNDGDSVNHITEGISKDLSLNSEINHSDTQGATTIVNFPETAPVSVNSMPCRDANCGHAHHTQLLPLGYTPEPPPLKRVKFDEHGDTHDIEVEGHGKVTVKYVNYESESQMKDIMSLITKDLSEPYSVYTYRYFIHNWPKLSFLVSP